MTSKITVDAHAGWPMKVTALDTFDGETKETDLGTVAPFETREFHCTNTRKLVVEELERPASE